MHDVGIRTDRGCRLLNRCTAAGVGKEATLLGSWQQLHHQGETSMQSKIRIIALAIVPLALLSFGASAASAEREAQGWKHWADFTANVVAHAQPGAYSPDGMKEACRGATGMTIGQGFQFPAWGRGVGHACYVYSQLASFNRNRASAGFVSTGDRGDIGSMLKKIHKRQKKVLCRRSRNAAHDLGKATPIASEPRAQQLAFDLAESMGRIYDSADCSGSKRTWQWHHTQAVVVP